MAALLAEVLAQKKILDKKVGEIKLFLQHEQNDALAKELFSLLELRQHNVLNIDAANNISTINIGGNDVTIAVAVRLRNTIKEKIDTLTMLINNKDCSLDKLKLQQQRDKYYNEFVLLTMGISMNDLQIKVS